jgi:hypothetical protein
MQTVSGRHLCKCNQELSHDNNIGQTCSSVTELWIGTRSYRVLSLTCGLSQTQSTDHEGRRGGLHFK